MASQLRGITKILTLITNNSQLNAVEVSNEQITEALAQHGVKMTDNSTKLKLIFEAREAQDANFYMSQTWHKHRYLYWN